MESEVLDRQESLRPEWVQKSVSHVLITEEVLNYMKYKDLFFKPVP